MLNKMAVRLSKRLLSHQVITEDILDIYVYGFELIISSLISTTLILLIGLLLNMFFPTVAFLVVFILLRSFSGGYHAKTYAWCSLITLGTYITVLTLSKFLDVPWIAYWILAGVGLGLLMILAPIENPNKQLSFAQKRKFKIISCIIFALFVSVGICLKEIVTQVSDVIFFTLVSDLFLLFMKNKKGKELKR